MSVASEMPIASTTTDRLELRARAEAGAIPEIRHAVRNFATAHEVDDVDAVALAVTEAVTNAVIHAYRCEEPGEVRVVACAEPSRLVVVVRDYGCGMGPRHDSPGLGIGLSTIGHLAGHFTVEAPDGEGTRLRMHFAR
jgi:stage II sporulation protein AB (anti-sigma F factor)